MKTSEVLRRIGDQIRTCGWTQRPDAMADGKGHPGPHCPVTAAQSLGFDFTQRTKAYDSLRFVLGTDEPIPMWNDRLGRTASEVLQDLDAAYVLQLQLEGEDPADYEVL